MLKKKFGPVFKELKNFLPKSSKKYGVGIRDPRSVIRDPEKKTIPEPRSGSRVEKAPDPGSGSATLLKMV
jgi:hypothetical protein